MMKEEDHQKTQTKASFLSECDRVSGEVLCVTLTLIAQPRKLTKASQSVSDVFNEIRQAAESKGSNETLWEDHYFFMLTARCKSVVTLPQAAATTLRHHLNSNYSMWLISQPKTSKIFFLSQCKTCRRDWFIRWLLEYCCQRFKLNAQDNLIINSYF